MKGAGWALTPGRPATTDKEKLKKLEIIRDTTWTPRNQSVQGIQVPKSHQLELIKRSPLDPRLSRKVCRCAGVQNVQAKDLLSGKQIQGQVCVFITAVPITKLFARGGGEWTQWRTCATRDSAFFFAFF